MSKDTRRWVKACSECGCRKTPRPLHAGVTEAVLATKPNEIWAIDFVGPLLTTDDGNKHLLCMVDVFTRWPEAFAVAYTNEDEVADCIYKLVCRRGRPDKIITDQGRSLVSAAVVKMCKQWGIRNVMTSGYNPTGNPSIERNHRYLMASLSILFDRSNPNWDLFLDAALFGYRVSVCDATGSSPYMMEHGRDPKLPASLNMAHDVYNTAEDYISATALKLQVAWENARQFQFEAAQKNQLRRKQHTVTFEPGAEVDIWMRASSQLYLHLNKEKLTVPKAFRNAWSGPHVIDSKLDDNHYLVLYEGKLVKHNVNRLRLRVHWDNVNRDTSAWYKKRSAGEVLELAPTKKAKVGADNLPKKSQPTTETPSSPICVGEQIVWIKAFSGRNTVDALPFGVGIVLNADNQNKLICQYLGNEKDLAFGLYKPMWYQPSDTKCYFRRAPMHSSHLKRTTADYKGDIDVADVIFRAPQVTDRRDHLSRQAQEAINANSYIQKHLKDDSSISSSPQ